ncbi:RNA polymerase subunit sigma-70 [Geodermatophilus maliterrae]|uniref:RNA polymerase subunit sigma-70 n=1 Tax=Geodermatophilus maliterrae TaxID=3162531 RepID=A0ABV3XKN4_9ACTN
MTVDDDPDLTAARSGDEVAFARLVGRHRRELAAHCYRMLGSPQDAEDAVQEALLAAWRGLPGFEGRSSLRTWLYRVTTSVCLRQARRRPRLLSPDAGPPRSDVADLGEPVPGPVWLEPLPGELVDDDEPATAYLRRESVELAYVAAHQHLPATQRAVLLLREVLGYSAAEAADLLDTTPASVNSALQRARAGVDERVPPVSQQVELARLGDTGTAALVDRFVAAWERADVPALVDLLTEDVRFTMPPLPAWFSGRDDVGRFPRRAGVRHALAADARAGQRLHRSAVRAVRRRRLASRLGDRPGPARRTRRLDRGLRRPRPARAVRDGIRRRPMNRGACVSLYW